MAASSLRSLFPMSPDVLALLTLVVALIGAACAIYAALAASRAARLAGANDPERAAEALRRALSDLRAELDQKSATQRLELNDALSRMGGGLDGRVGQLAESLGLHFTAFAEVQQKAGETLSESQRLRLAETNAAVAKLVETLSLQQQEGRKAMGEELEKVRATLTENLAGLRKENEAKLEQMRVTVDEKLQGTLTERLGENFKMVSERLDTVHKGLGEMQLLATGVGDLKRTLTNIKARGSWGEVQLGALLEDMLTPDQFGRQVPVRKDSREVVDYAVYLPGQTEGGRLLLPLDCKFPQADYDNLLAAQDAGDPVAVELAAKGLERALRIQAKSIRDKYVHPPETTPFAILYLPTEGLFAEVIRRPGLAAALSNEFSITVTGPTTLAATLNSLKMGFQTLAIQKNAGDIAQVLGEAKKAFQDYGTALDAVDKKLVEARNKVADVGVKHRAVTRKLRGVEATGLSGAATPLLAVDPTELLAIEDEG
jgi:DNA recombination protein RmuC